MLCILLILVFTSLFTSSSSCTTFTFRNTLLNVTVENEVINPDEPPLLDFFGKRLPKKILLNVTGCVGPTEEFLDVLTLECLDQPIQVIQKKAFNNLDKLQDITLSGNNINVIVPGFLENLSNITKLSITSNKMIKLLPKTFSDAVIKNIDLKRNRIKSIGKSTFCNLVNLEEVNLESNRITEWDPQWFNMVPNLSHLYLSDNLIETIEAEAFKLLPRLSVLYLNKNLISVIDGRAFVGKTSFFTLDLGYNRLKSFSKELFTPLNGEIPAEPGKPPSFYSISMSLNLRKRFSGILNLHINNNNLTYLPDKMLKDLGGDRTMSMLTLHSNPWQCSCLNKIHQWAVLHRISVDRIKHGCIDKRNPVCVYPLKNPNECQEVVDEELYETYFAALRPVKPDIFNRVITCL